LRRKEDNQALIQAIKDGVIDVFATDHAPHTPDEKNVEFDMAPFGINGLETAVSLLLDKLVKQKYYFSPKIHQDDIHHSSPHSGARKQGKNMCGS